MIWVYEDECKEAGIDADKVRSIARRLSRAAAELEKMGGVIVTDLCGGSAFLCINDNDDNKEPLMIADLDAHCWRATGGSSGPRDDGFNRCEFTGQRIT